MKTYDMKEPTTGDIYLKKPEIISVREEDKEYIKRVKEQLKENPNPKVKVLVEEFEQLAKKEGEMDYTGCDNFWILKDDNFVMTVDEQPTGLHRAYFDVSELNEKFIDLRQFLDEAEYVGRKFCYPEKPDEPNVLNIDFDKTLLYKTDDIWIVLSKDFGLIDRIEIFHKSDGKSLEDEYEFYGEQNNEFRDKEALYEMVKKQVYNAPKNTPW